MVYYVKVTLYLILSFLFMHYYPYYPILPLRPSPYPPSSSIHLHTQLAAIHHSHLLRQQSQLDYFSRVHLEHQYSSDVFEKELRIAKMIDSNMSHLMLERQMLEEQRIKQEVRFKEQLGRLERERYGVTKEGQGDEENIDSYQRQQTKKEKIKEGNGYYGSQGGQIFNIRPKEYHTNPKENSQPQNESSKRETIYQSSRREKVKSVANNISYNQPEAISLNNSNTKRHNSILKKSNFTLSPKLKKTKKVKFLKDSPSFQQANSSSYCLNNSVLKAAHGNSNNHKLSASKKIQNRLKLSEIVFRDSQYRNVKHEVVHLTNTYETQCRLRRDVKNKINNKDQIIQKYCLVTPE